MGRSFTLFEGLSVLLIVRVLVTDTSKCYLCERWGVHDCGEILFLHMVAGCSNRWQAMVSHRQAKGNP